MRLILNIKKTATLSRIEELGAFMNNVKAFDDSSILSIPGFYDVIESVSMEK